MSDRFPGDIIIGGRIPRRLRDDLAGMTAEQGVGINWQATLDRADIRAAIEAAAAKGGTVLFTDDAALNGKFEELEGWLTRHGIDFDRHSDARYEYSAQNVYGRGRRCPVEMRSDQCYADMVSAAMVRQILESRSPVDRRLAILSRLAAVPPALTPIVLTD